MDLFCNDRQFGKNVIGVDEAGRGPLAGPVVACAVSITHEIQGINDSKLLSEKKRYKLASEIIKHGKIGIGIGSVAEIDYNNILSCTLNAMSKAVNSLTSSLDGDFVVLVDGNQKIPGIKSKCHTIVHGDRIHYSIACASIVAKAIRDYIMLGFDENFPDFGFISHKGYGTKEHLEAISRHGISSIHRRSFRPCR
jgi:ribonuclease HII